MTHDELVKRIGSVIEDYEHMINYDPYILYEKVAELFEELWGMQSTNKNIKS